jgi:hypothetical protein
MQTATEHSNDKLATSQPRPKPSAILGWLVEQVTILAEAMGEAMTPARLKIYAADLADLEPSQLQTAFARARRELKFFPKIAELRDLAGAGAKDERSVEAEAAWKFANDYLRKWGIDRLPLFRAGATIEAPPIPERVDYALRRIGGLRGLNQVTEESRPFMFRDFCEAYNLAPIAGLLAPQIAAKFPLEGKIKLLSDGARMERAQENKPTERTFRPKPIPQPLTDVQRRDRLEILRQQAASLHPPAQREMRIDGQTG